MDARNMKFFWILYAAHILSYLLIVYIFHLLDILFFI